MLERQLTMTVFMAVTSCNQHNVTEMSKVKLQVSIDSDIKKNLAKLAIDKDKTMSELVEDALQRAFFSDCTKSKGAK
jgi:exosome complex RNA-binding protein Rrp42 (RNase PH superfamily)